MWYLRRLIWTLPGSYLASIKLLWHVNIRMSQNSVQFPYFILNYSELENYKCWFLHLYSARINFPDLLLLVAVLVGFWLASTNQNRVAIKWFSYSLTWCSGDSKALQWLFGNALLLVAPSKISLMSSHSHKSGALCSGLNNMLSDSKAYCP